MRVDYNTLRVAPVKSGIIHLSLNRPSALNAINSVMMSELAHFWAELPSTDARVVVLSGEGERSFCAGADLKERRGLDEKTWRYQHAQLQHAMRLMVACPVPLIAAVNGYAFGGGLELVLASDYALAAEHAQFALPEAKLGIMPGAMGTQLLPRAVGMRLAKQMIFSGKRLDAQQAKQVGIVVSVESASSLLERAFNEAELIIQSAPLSLQAIKKSINHAVAGDLLAGYEFEVEQYNALLSTDDRIEGISAFNEKRKPNFTGK